MATHDGTWARPGRDRGAGDGSRLQAGAAGAVAGFGAAFLGHHVLTGAGSMVPELLLELPLLLLALALVYGGYWLLDCDLGTWRVGRVALWSAAGLVGLVGVALWLHPAGGTTLETALDLTADLGTVGAAAGLLVGLETERSRGRPVTAPPDPRFEFFNRLLRHHLLNGVAVIKGHAELLVETEAEPSDAAEVVRNRADELADLVRNMATLGLAVTGELPTVPVDPHPALASAATRVGQQRPGADVVVGPPVEGRVLANDQLETAVAALLRAAVDAADGSRVRVSTVGLGGVVEVRFGYDGPPPDGLGAEPELDRYGEGDLGLLVAEALVETAGGVIVGATGTGFAVRLRAAD